MPAKVDPAFQGWDDFYAEVFAIADALSRSNEYVIASEIAIATDGTTSGEILPKRFVLGAEGELTCALAVIPNPTDSDRSKR